MDRMDEDPPAFVPVVRSEGSWKTPAGDPVPWYDVRTDLLPADEVQAAIERVLSVYGVSDVVVDAFTQLRKELPRPLSPPPAAE
ncbi:MAG: hypothetical protein E6J00_03850 [Chloroflexi bacterium]|nr:MAG: hypothetical protein E6J00_03850 [Chloroflexota bacterium]